MSQRSDISQSIQANFPDNQTNFITPTRLRSEQGLFEQYSVLNEQTASIIAEAVASSSASPINTGSLATTGSNTFTGNQYYNASGSYPSLAIDLGNNTSWNLGWNDYKNGSQITLVSASTVEFQEGEYIGQNGMYFRRNTFLIFNSGSEVYAQSGSSSVTGSNGQVLGKTNGVISWVNQSTGSTINTGSFATTGSNTFNGNQSISGSLHQSGTFYPDQIDWISSSIQQGTGSYILTTDSNGVTQYDNFQNIASALQPYIQTGSVINTGSLATTGSNTFNGTNTFTGSLNAESASITFLTVGTIVSSSTIFSSGSNTLGDASNDVQTLWGTVDIKTGPLQVSGSTNISGSLVINGVSPVLSNQTSSFVTNAQTSSFATNAVTASSLVTASVILNTITFTKGDASTFNLTVDTGSAGGGMNLGANTFTGSQTIASSSLILNASGTLSLSNNVTESRTTTVGFGNIILNTRTNAATSGSVIISGSGNIVNYSGVSIANPSGYIGNNNIGLAPIYSGSILPNYNTNVAPSAMTVSASSPITIAGNWIAGGSPLYTTATTATSSFSFNVLNGNSIRITASLSGSSAGTSVGVANNNLGGANHLIIFEGSSSVARNFQNNIIAGTNNTASLTSAAGVVITTGSLQNSFILGSNLIMSGTMLNTSLSSSTFVGQYNELTATYAPADPSIVRFAVGTGTSAAARRTSLQVFGTGEVVISAAGGGISSRAHSQFSQSAAQIVNSTINAATTVQQYNGSFVTNGGSIGGFTNAIVASETSVIAAGRSSVIAGASGNTISTNSGGTDTNNAIIGANASTISGSTSRFTGIFASTGSFINESINSAIIAGNVNTRLSNVTGSVALSRDTAYTGSANYTLYTQNINASGSVSITGSATITDVLVLPFQASLPAGRPTGSIALSGSGATFVGMFVYDGTNWIKMSV